MASFDSPVVYIVLQLSPLTEGAVYERVKSYADSAVCSEKQTELVATAALSAATSAVRIQ